MKIMNILFYAFLACIWTLVIVTAAFTVSMFFIPQDSVSIGLAFAYPLRIFKMIQC